LFPVFLVFFGQESLSGTKPSRVCSTWLEWPVFAASCLPVARDGRQWAPPSAEHPPHTLPFPSSNLSTHPHTPLSQLRMTRPDSQQAGAAGAAHVYFARGWHNRDEPYSLDARAGQTVGVQAPAIQGRSVCGWHVRQRPAASLRPDSTQTLRAPPPAPACHGSEVALPPEPVRPSVCAVCRSAASLSSQGEVPPTGA
jgi:hypothetical protein